MLLAAPHFETRVGAHALPDTVCALLGTRRLARRAFHRRRRACTPLLLAAPPARPPYETRRLRLGRRVAANDVLPQSQRRRARRAKSAAASHAAASEASRHPERELEAALGARLLTHVGRDYDDEMTTDSPVRCPARHRAYTRRPKHNPTPATADLAAGAHWRAARFFLGAYARPTRRRRWASPSTTPSPSRSHRSYYAHPAFAVCRPRAPPDRAARDSRLDTLSRHRTTQRAAPAQRDRTWGIAGRRDVGGDGCESRREGCVGRRERAR